MNPEIREHLQYVAEHSPDPVERVKAQVRLAHDGFVTAGAIQIQKAAVRKAALAWLRKDDDRACPKCGAMADDDDRYCPHCGSSLPTVGDADGDQEFVCTGCGLPLDDDDGAYCPGCGQARQARSEVVKVGRSLIRKAAILQADGSFSSRALSQADPDQALDERMSAVVRRQAKTRRRLAKAERKGDLVKAEKLRKRVARLEKAAEPILTKRAAEQRAASDRQAALDRTRSMNELLGLNWSDPAAILRHQARVLGYREAEEEANPDG